MLTLDQRKPVYVSACWNCTVILDKSLPRYRAKRCFPSPILFFTHHTFSIKFSNHSCGKTKPPWRQHITLMTSFWRFRIKSDHHAGENKDILFQHLLKGLVFLPRFQSKQTSPTNPSPPKKSQTQTKTHRTSDHFADYLQKLFTAFSLTLSPLLQVFWNSLMTEEKRNNVSCCNVPFAKLETIHAIKSSAKV